MIPVQLYLQPKLPQIKAVLLGIVVQCSRRALQHQCIKQAACWLVVAVLGICLVPVVPLRVSKLAGDAVKLVIRKAGHAERCVCIR